MSRTISCVEPTTSHLCAVQTKFLDDDIRSCSHDCDWLLRVKCITMVSSSKSALKGEHTKHGLSMNNHHAASVSTHACSKDDVLVADWHRHNIHQLLAGYTLAPCLTTMLNAQTWVTFAAMRCHTQTLLATDLTMQLSTLQDTHPPENHELFP